MKHSANTRRAGRVWIITPGMRADRYDSARTSGAGVALVDLEDSVAPQDKQAARTAAQDFFTPPTASCTLGVRMNSPATPDGARDLVAIADYAHRPGLVLIPKVESSRDLELVAGVLDADDHTPDLWALIETPRAFDRLPSILNTPRLAGVVFGSADYAAAVGCGLGWEQLLYARSALANSAAAGIPAVDAPVFGIDDPNALRAEAEKAKQLGFYGKGAVHPRQVALINEVFTPTQEEIARASAVLAARQESGSGVTSVAGQMVGTPFFKAAEALLAEADR